MRLDAISEVVRTFRPLGFFRKNTQRTARGVAEALIELPDEWTGGLADYAPDPDEPGGFQDLAVLAYDRDRVWRLESWERLFDRSARDEGFAYCKNYRDVLNNLARISAHRCSFECVASRGGSMTIAFGGATHAIRFRTDGGSLAREFLAKVNEVIAPSGHELVFVSYLRFCTGYVVLLSTSEKRRLAQTRGWEYLPLEE